MHHGCNVAASAVRGLGVVHGGGGAQAMTRWQQHGHAPRSAPLRAPDNGGHRRPRVNQRLAARHCASAAACLGSDMRAAPPSVAERDVGAFELRGESISPQSFPLEYRANCKFSKYLFPNIFRLYYFARKAFKRPYILRSHLRPSTSTETGGRQTLHAP